VVTCNSYTLTALLNGGYFTGAGGSGSRLNAGDVLTFSQDIYVYANDGRCPNENRFRVNIVDTTVYQPIIACGSFTLPPIPFGNYSNQGFGGGTAIPAGTVITSSQTVYYYAVTTNGVNCTDNLSYQITISPLPLVDIPPNRLECQSYILPPLTNGNYYTETNGGGLSLNAGDVISNTQTIYIYAVGGGCTNQHVFQIEIRSLPPVDSFTDVFTCATFTLPTLTNGVYYTATAGVNGSGSLIPMGAVIAVKQRIYIYNEWGDFKTCSNETFFTVDARGIEVGTFADVNVCDSYQLPALTIGDYYSQPNGQGPIIPVGTVLTTSQTIYVYKREGARLTCSDEDDFIVTISATPVLPNQPNIEACKTYTLPSLTLGNYFSGPNGTGTAYNAGQNCATPPQSPPGRPAVLCH